MVDLDDAKYDRTVKTVLLQQKQQRRRRHNYRNGTSIAKSTTTTTTTLVVVQRIAMILIILVGIGLLCLSLQHRMDAQVRQARQQRLARAEELWKLRQQGGGGGVDAPALADHLDAQQQDVVVTTSSNNRLFLQQFAQWRTHPPDQPGVYPKIRHLLEAWLDDEDLDVRKNVRQPHPRWIRPYLLPPHFGAAGFKIGTDADDGDNTENHHNNNSNNKNINNKRGRPQQRRIRGLDHKGETEFFKVSRHAVDKDDTSYPMVWHDEYQQLLQRYGTEQQFPGPPVDYTDRTKYVLPEMVVDVPPDDQYPVLQPLGQLLQAWPQDEDFSGGPVLVVHETLQHFNYSDPRQRATAVLFRHAALPFKVYDVPELTAVSDQWSDDDYVARMFGERAPDRNHHHQRGGDNNDPPPGERVPVASGTAQESPNNYFAFYVPKAWDLHNMGLPPTRNNDWSYREWSQHARYADAVNLTADRPHFYWQAGVPPEERYQDRSHWTFISRDLPSFSSRKSNFFVFSPDEQKGIQCRFGERGVVAATHFDGGRNMVAMIRGAKRYILSPPNQCSKLGIFTQKRSPIYRHSLLNFGHIQYLHNDTVVGMSPEERAWLERAATSQAVETVLKQGEVLYIPSHWFHYIISLQKSAQCNVRSGVDKEGHPRFGGRQQVEECIDIPSEEATQED